MIRCLPATIVLGQVVLAFSTKDRAVVLSPIAAAHALDACFGNVAGLDRPGSGLSKWAADHELTSFTSMPDRTGALALLRLAHVANRLRTALFHPVASASTADQVTVTPRDPTAWRLQANKSNPLMAAAPAASAPIGMASLTRHFLHNNPF